MATQTAIDPAAATGADPATATGADGATATITAGAHQATAADRSWLRGWRAPLLVTALLYVGVTFLLLRAFDFNPSGPIRIGGIVPADRFWTEGVRVDRDGVGYDGQWFFYLAHDPLLRASDPESFLDLPAYRYARILYPSLAWAVTLGQPAGLPWALLGVNLAAVLLGTAACVDLLRQLGASRWLALVYALSPPVLLGTLADLAEPTAFALVVLGLTLALRRRHWLAGTALALATLSREPSILIPIGLGLYALGRWDWRRGTAYLMPLLAPVSWHLTIWARLGALPSAQSPTNFGVPFGGAYYRLGLLLGWHPPRLGEPVPSSNVLPEVTIVVVSAVVIAIGLVKILERRDAFAWLLWLQAALALGTGPLVWADLYSYGRVLGLVYFCYGLALLTAPQRAASGAARLHDWATPVPAWTIFAKPDREPSLAAIPARYRH